MLKKQSNSFEMLQNSCSYFTGQSKLHDQFWYQRGRKTQSSHREGQQIIRNDNAIYQIINQTSKLWCIRPHFLTSVILLSMPVKVKNGRGDVKFIHILCSWFFFPCFKRLWQDSICFLSPSFLLLRMYGMWFDVS